MLLVELQEVEAGTFGLLLGALVVVPVDHPAHQGFRIPVTVGAVEFLVVHVEEIGASDNRLEMLARFGEGWTAGAA